MQWNKVHVLAKVGINEKMTKILDFFGRKKKRNLAKELF
jgi:hypothetical protein